MTISPEKVQIAYQALCGLGVSLASTAHKWTNEQRKAWELAERTLRPFGNPNGALTEEDMHSKAEIAAELAHRDLQIDNLRAELAACKADAERYRWLRNPRGWPAVFSGAEEPEPVTGETLDSMVDYVRKGEV